MGRLNRVLIIGLFGLIMGFVLPGQEPIIYIVFSILFMVILNPIVKVLKLDKYINSNMFID